MATKTATKPSVYIAGPMTGYDQYNFPLFDSVRDRLRDMGYHVISPADLDRSVGFEGENKFLDTEFLEAAMRRDIEAIMKVDGMVMLPGWQASTGASAEYGLAKWRHLPVYEWPDVPHSVFFGESPESIAAVAGEEVEDCEPAPQPPAAVDPKQRAASAKAPLHLLPPVAEALICEVLAHGAAKYGEYNWRLSDGLSMRIYDAAFRRHLAAIKRGEWIDRDSCQPHIAHIGAAAAVLLDADHHNKLDRRVIIPERLQ